jgi:hypothetical protein
MLQAGLMWPTALMLQDRVTLLARSLSRKGLRLREGLMLWEVLMVQIGLMF